MLEMEEWCNAKLNGRWLLAEQVNERIILILIEFAILANDPPFIGEPFFAGVSKKPLENDKNNGMRHRIMFQVAMAMKEIQHQKMTRFVMLVNFVCQGESGHLAV